LEENKNNLENYAPFINIEEYLWEMNPQQLIDLKNLFLQDKVKIIEN